MFRRSADLPEAGERGIALVLVLWMLALLAIIVVGFAGDARTQLHLARNQRDAAVAQAIADAGPTFAILGVLASDPSKRWRADGEEHALRYADGDLRVSVQDEGGKLDLNNSSLVLLASLFRQLGVANADRIAAAVAAARQMPISDEARQRATAPAFVAVEDLRRIPGVDRTTYEHIAPFLTVYSGSSQIDPMTAPRAVLLSLPDVQEDTVDQFVAQRAAPAAIASDFPIVVSHGDFLTAVPLRVFTVRSDAKTATGARFVREAVVLLTPQSLTSFRILSWRRAPRDDADGEGR